MAPNKTRFGRENSVTQDSDPRAFFARVNAVALPHLESLCHEWTGQGRRVGREYVALNPRRADRREGSFKINLDSGRWADFASGDAGGDPVSLYAYLNGLGQMAAARALADRLGVTS
jgi:hypothetical protein